jgi:hypothetical protein
MADQEQNGKINMCMQMPVAHQEKQHIVKRATTNESLTN